MILRDKDGKPLQDDCPCPTYYKDRAFCPDCPNRSVNWCEKCGEEVDSWFDRTVCPEPCGSMHERCEKCGTALDDCDLEDKTP